jgi:hypothetical protein
MMKKLLVLITLMMPFAGVSAQELSLETDQAYVTETKDLKPLRDLSPDLWTPGNLWQTYYANTVNTQPARQLLWKNYQYDGDIHKTIGENKVESVSKRNPDFYRTYVPGLPANAAIHYKQRAKLGWKISNRYNNKYRESRVWTKERPVSYGIAHREVRGQEGATSSQHLTKRSRYPEELSGKAKLCRLYGCGR